MSGILCEGKSACRRRSSFQQRRGIVEGPADSLLLLRNRQLNTQPVIRGRKLVLNYTDGSPCPALASDKHRRAELDTLDQSEFFSSPSSSSTTNTTEIIDDPSPSGKLSSTRRKNSIISFLCDRDPLNPPLTLSFVASPDECTYIFEARSGAACAGIEQAKQTLSPGGVFGVIAIIALLVYLVGGCVYSRTVLNQRGWRQLPNYALWAGIFGFFRVSYPFPYPPPRFFLSSSLTGARSRTSSSSPSPPARAACPAAGAVEAVEAATRASMVGSAGEDARAGTAMRRTG